MDGNIEDSRLEKQFAEQLDENGEISPEAMADMLDGNFAGDTNGAEPTPASKEEPPVEPEQEIKADKPETPEVEKPTEKPVEPEKVILAKDGEHTIPYEKLEEARQEASRNKDLAAQQQKLIDDQKALIESLQGSKKEPAPETEEELSESMQNFMQDYPELAKDVMGVMSSNKDLSQKVQELQSMLVDNQAKTEADKHFDTIRDAYSDYEATLQGEEFSKWLNEQTPIVKSAYETVFKQGTASQVIEMLDSFSKANPSDIGEKPTTKEPDAARKVAEKVAAAKEKTTVPGSLSEVPGGQAPQDETEVLLNSSAMSQMEKFESMTPDQIEAALTKAL